MPDQDRRDYCMRRLSSLKLERESFINHYKELSEYIEPRRGRFFITDRNKGDRRNNKIINSRGTQALRTAQSGMFAGIMSPGRPWFKFEPLEAEKMRRANVKDWLYAVEQKIRTIFLEGNLYNMAPVMLGELLLFGTGAMSHVDDFNDVCRFYTHTVGSYLIGQDDRGEINTFALEKEMTVGQMVKMFGKNNCSKAVQDQYDKGNLDAWYPVVQLIEPNDNARYDNPRSEFKAFKSIWYEPGNDRGRDQFLRQSGFDEFPVHVPRWAVTGEDIYGTNSPGMVALGDVKSLQIMEKRKAQAIDKLVNPPLKGPPSLRNTPIASLPGSVTIYDGDASKEGLTTLYQVEPRIQEMRADIEAVEKRLNEAFFVDLFMAISAMEGIQPKNQLELSQRNEERLLMLGPPLERLQEEFLSNLILRTFKQGMRAGIFPEPPPELNGEPLGIRYISALAMAQRAVEVGAIERTAIFASQLAGVNQEVLDKFNTDEALEQYARMNGTPPSIINDDDQVNAIRKQRQQVQQAAAGAAITKDAAAAADSGASAVKQMTEAASG